MKDNLIQQTIYREPDARAAGSICAQSGQGSRRGDGMSMEISLCILVLVLLAVTVFVM